MLLSLRFLAFIKNLISLLRTKIRRQSFIEVRISNKQVLVVRYFDLLVRRLTCVIKLRNPQLIFIKLVHFSSILLLLVIHGILRQDLRIHSRLLINLGCRRQLRIRSCMEGIHDGLCIFPSGLVVDILRFLSLRKYYRSFIKILYLDLLIKVSIGRRFPNNLIILLCIKS